KLRATGEIRARWKNRSDYEADFKVADFRAEFNKDEYRFSGSGRVSPDVLDLENVRIANKDGFATASTVSVDRRASTGKVAAGFRGSFAGREADTSLSADISFAPIADWTKALSALDRGAATISVGRSRYGTVALEPFGLSLTKDGASLTLDGGPQNSLRLRFEAGGAFFAAVSAPSPIRGNVVGTIKNGMIEARAGSLYLDFASLWSVLNIPDVVFSGGIATGALTISGPLADPEFFGTATATGFRATVPAWVTEEIGPVSASVEFEGKEFGFGPVAVSANKGAGNLKGRFRFDRWVPFEFSLDVDIAKRTPLPAKADVSGFTAQGLASGKLSLVNTVETLLVSGKLDVESTTMTIDAKMLQSLYAKPFTPAGITVDLNLVTGKKVEFDWPSSEYPILRGYADIGDSLHITFDGMTGRYALIGDIDLRGGEVFYFMRSFYIRSGSIKFNENQIQVDPRLSLRAEIRDQNEEGPVTVSLVVDEARLSSFMPRFESTPPLSQSEILGMLGQNALGADSTANTAATKGAVLNATSDVLAQFNVVRVFERNVREVFGFDMFSIRTQLIQNAFFGATGINSDPVDRKAGLGNYFDNTTVYMGKFLGSDIFMQGMLSLQKDESKSTDLLGGLTIAPEIGVEWKTPLFLLRWNFAPDWANNRERLFINDHSFTLTWRKSF
ncbi:MAG: translocation/assembly module TamB domain-containing protein, partial [Treponemataceae bacterium]